MVIALRRITPEYRIAELLNPGQGYTPDTPITDMVRGTKCHEEQNVTSHISVVGPPLESTEDTSRIPHLPCTVLILIPVNGIS